MRIATYNVNGINGRIDILVRWLDETAPDVVCLQELKAPDGRFPIRDIEKVGYGAIWHGQRSWNGVAILCKAKSRCSHEKGCRAIPTMPKADT